jgi:hypothetical protein
MCQRRAPKTYASAVSRSISTSVDEPSRLMRLARDRSFRCAWFHELAIDLVQLVQFPICWRLHAELRKAGRCRLDAMPVDDRHAAMRRVGCRFRRCGRVRCLGEHHDCAGACQHGARYPYCGRAWLGGEAGSSFVMACGSSLVPHSSPSLALMFRHRSEGQAVPPNSDGLLALAYLVPSLELTAASDCLFRSRRFGGGDLH